MDQSRFWNIHSECTFRKNLRSGINFPDLYWNNGEKEIENFMKRNIIYDNANVS